MSYKIWLEDKPHSKEGHNFEATLTFNGQEIWGPSGAHENTSRLRDALHKADPRFDIILNKKSHSVEGHVRYISVIHHGRLILNKLSTHDNMEGLVKAVDEKWAEGGTYGITGIPRPDDLQDKTINIPFVPEMPVRYNVEFLATEKKLRKQWTLFVLALEKFKNKPIQDKLSYFQIAGIHAAPYLKEHLKWRFVLLGGKVVSETLYPDTLVTVFKGTGRFNIQEKKPVEKNLTFASLVAGFSYRMPLEVIRPDKMSSDKVSMAVTSYDSEYEALVDVTKGKAGGYGGE